MMQTGRRWGEGRERDRLGFVHIPDEKRSVGRGPSKERRRQPPPSMECVVSRRRLWERPAGETKTHRFTVEGRERGAAKEKWRIR